MVARVGHIDLTNDIESAGIWGTAGDRKGPLHLPTPPLAPTEMKHRRLLNRPGLSQSLIDASTCFNYNIWEKLDNHRKFLLTGRTKGYY
jgi:hypothetical protein